MTQSWPISRTGLAFTYEVGDFSGKTRGHMEKYAKINFGICNYKHVDENKNSSVDDVWREHEKRDKTV